MDFGQYWQEIVAFATPFMGLIVYSGMKFIKKQLSSKIVKDSAFAIKNELGEENYNALLGVVKNYGVAKLVQAIKDVSGKVEQFNDILPLLKVMLANQIALGVYDDNPEGKEILEKIING